MSSTLVEYRTQPAHHLLLVISGLRPLPSNINFPRSLILILELHNLRHIFLDHRPNLGRSLEERSFPVFRNLDGVCSGAGEDEGVDLVIEDVHELVEGDGAVHDEADLFRSERSVSKLISQ